MKNAEIVIETGEIHAYMRNLWRTPEFRKSHDEKGFVWRAVEDFARQPRFFFEMSDTEKEPSHFSSWWGGIQKREYANDAVHDLYYLHEITHAGTMIYVPGLEYENFRRKMDDNELKASVASEIRAYFEMPTLREKSFPHEIYADRFLNDPKIQERWKDEPERVIDEIALRRRNVMTTQVAGDRVEYWIHKFANQNESWATVWYDRYDKVEQAMTLLRDECREKGKGPAMGAFMSWLTSPEITQGTDVPFPEEAGIFAGIYWKNKRLYAAEHAATPAVARPSAAFNPVPK